MNALFNLLGGDQLREVMYWSSAEDSDDENFAWYMDFYYANVDYGLRDLRYRVRAVCAF